jgi:predicted DNA-binding protein (MmcQ/YjbR family)
MLLDWLRPYCLSFPGATENIQWENNLVFKVAGKMFAVADLEPGKQVLAFKCSPEEFAELTERPGITPAPYLARAQWVALAREKTIPRRELEELLKRSYELVAAKLPKSVRSRVVAPSKPRRAARKLQ